MGQHFFQHYNPYTPHAERDIVSFELFVRKIPPHRGYMITAGLGTALWWLEHIEFGDREWQWMVDNGFDRGYATWLYEKANNAPRFFTGDVHAIPEGTPIAAETPILRVTAPRIEATLVESFLLAAINHQVMVASKAARIVEAAQGRPVWDFSLRRLHGPDAGIGVARAAYIAGFAGTATAEAGALLGIPTTGTMAHHYVQANGPDNEAFSFADFMQSFPDTHALLVDTYDVERGIDNAIRAAEDTGISLNAIRLDSGDLYTWAKVAREKLDLNPETRHAQIMASNDLDEYAIDVLVRDRAPIDVFGVGTMLGTVPDAPNVGGVYKLVEQHAKKPRYVMKFSEAKSTDPGCHQVWRPFGFGRDLISLADEEVTGQFIPLIEQVMKGGRTIRQPSLDAIRANRSRWMNDLPNEVRRLNDPALLKITRSAALLALKRELMEENT